jgi:hypothetical protein
MAFAMKGIDNMGTGFLVVFNQQDLHGTHQTLTRVIVPTMAKGCKPTGNSAPPRIFSPPQPAARPCRVAK